MKKIKVNWCRLGIHKWENIEGYQGLFGSLSFCKCRKCGKKKTIEYLYGW